MENHTKIWTSVDGTQYNCYQPPTENLTIVRKYPSEVKPDLTFDASALVLPSNSNLENTKSIIAQNNWTNMALYTIGQQMDRIEYSPSPKEHKDIPSSSVVYPVDIHPPLYVPDFKDRKSVV